MENLPLILLVDDDQELCDLIGEYLSAEGFAVDKAHSGQSALTRLASPPECQLIVLDIMMPGLSGLDVLQRLRPSNSTPVIMLTGRGDDIDRILGLEMGADDYLAKPCNPRELVARVRAILRRTQNPTSGDQHLLDVAGIQLSPADMQAKALGTPLQLTGAEFNTLKVLMQHPGQTQTKAFLTEQVLHRPLTAYDRSIDVHVSRIRQKLANAGIHDIIRSVRGVGYQLLSAD
ncbi:response regulator transcription factor [Teredinibacter turnerae]|uniref:response regulator transcription factor n=1 Tax=Teredinibacter turnerae TaxID=2426 RepID=UPI000415FACD|nr:response regulator transcription factor [Teredinibacter turnerae]